MIKRLIALAAACALAGCGIFGHAIYEVTAAPGADGKTVYNVKVGDGKEYAGRIINFQQNGAGGFGMMIQESESKAFAGQAIGAKAMTVLPVTGLKDLVPAEVPPRLPPLPAAPSP